MRALPLVVRLAAMLGCLSGSPAFANSALERHGEPLDYAVIEFEKSNLNIDSIVLACEQAGDVGGLQLQIYPSTEGPLLPKGATPQQLKGNPRAEIVIDGRVFPVALLFADIYAVLGDETDQRVPRLSEHLIDDMATGRIMILRFDLLTENAGQPATLDGEAVIALQPINGGTAVAAVRGCAAATADLATAGRDLR